MKNKVWLGTWKNTVLSNKGTITETTVNKNISGTAKQMNDFALSVSNETPSIVGLILCGIWLIGILAMLLFVVRSVSRLNTLKKSALPLQNKTIRLLYNNCLRKKPSVYRKLKGLTAFAVIAVLLLGLTPMLFTYAAEQNQYTWNISPEKVGFHD